MIEEQFVGYETAKLLKKAGFCEPCFFLYTKSGTVWRCGGPEDCNDTDSLYSRPTQAVAARWLREVHNLHVYAIQTNLPLTKLQTTEWEWGYIVTKVDDPNTPDKLFDMNYTTYEDAMEAGIRHAIESVIDKMDGERATEKLFIAP